ncbi:MAG TPA: response regulator transcription factor [Bacteroidales bacterium]
MIKILVVEDELNMLLGLKKNLEFETYQVDTANDGQTGLSKLLNNPYDLIILDVMLPDISGFDICKTARKKNIETPIILLTAKNEEIDKVLGLELGADDYITKPFSLRELLARIKAILRRTAVVSVGSNEEVTIGKLRVNFKSHESTVDGLPVKMTHKEIDILHYLYVNNGKTINRDEIMDNIWSIDSDLTNRTIDNFILKLRQKIEVNPNFPKIIHTVHGVGYKLVL